MLEIETMRLVIREFQDEDIPALYQLFSDAETMKYYPAPFSLLKTKEWVQRNQESYEKNGFGLWAVHLKDSKQCIGDCGLVAQVVDGEPEVEVGYHINKKYWSKGYATEAAQACTEYGFHQLGLQRLISIIDPKNTASIRVAEKNGFRKKKTSFIFDKEHAIYSRSK